MKTYLGLMSGTSMDGIDLALIRTDGEERIEFGPVMAVEHPPALRRRIETGLEDAKRIEEREDRPGGLAELETAVTEVHGAAVERFLASHAIERTVIEAIGFHGQTVLHRPEDGITVQLGDGEHLAAMTKCPVVYDFRAQDMRAGGQGAPLVPVFHRALLRQAELEGPTALVNIGGISNITYIDGDELIAFDTGPGNALIDQWVQAGAGIPFDQGGRIASEGRAVSAIVERYLAHPFFEEAAPKSLDRADFEPLAAGVAELSDGARSLAEITARSIIKAADHLPRFPERWVVCGGGRLNDAIMRDLKRLCLEHGSEAMPAEDIGLDGDMLEAQAFAYLAARSLGGLPLTFPTTTGCSQPQRGGVLVRPHQGP